jgi:hypothetical protein
VAKETLKEAARVRQENHCDLTGRFLPTDNSLTDTHRPHPKRRGGTYTARNTIIVEPVAHMREHGTLRVRSDAMNELKSMVDDRNIWLRAMLAAENRLRAFNRRVDHMNENTHHILLRDVEAYKSRVARFDRSVKNLMKTFLRSDPIARAMASVRGVGDITIAYCLVYLIPEIASHASSYWSYVGYDKPKRERYQKGVKGGGNKSLRTVLYNMATVQLKLTGPYEQDYRRVKLRLEHSENEVESKNTAGNWVTLQWRHTKPSHRHGAALRYMQKLFLAHLWLVSRTILGLPISEPYAEAVLGNGHDSISPEERGWSY